MAEKTQKTAKNAAKAPISTHPLFAVIVALWFAALLGLGSFVLPAQLLETVAAATGLSAIVPSAAPPLGLTARIAIAVAAAVTGALAGLLIARRVGAVQAATAAPRRSLHARKPIEDAPARRPLSIHDEVESEPLHVNDGGSEPQAAPATGNRTPGNQGVRRRALAVTDEDGPSELLNTVPLPGADFGAASALADHDQLEEAVEEDMLELGAYDEAEPDEPGEPFENLRFAIPDSETTPAVFGHESNADSGEVDPELETLKNYALPAATGNPAPFSAPDTGARDEAAADFDSELALTAAAFRAPADEPFTLGGTTSASQYGAAESVRFAIPEAAIEEQLMANAPPDQEPSGGPLRFAVPGDIGDSHAPEPSENRRTFAPAPFAPAEFSPESRPFGSDFTLPDDDADEDDFGDWAADAGLSGAKEEAPEVMGITFEESPAEEENNEGEHGVAACEAVGTTVAAEPAHGVPVVERPLSQLGMAELVERLAHAIQDRQAGSRPEARATTADAPAPEPVAASRELPSVESPAAVGLSFAQPAASDDAPSVKAPLQFDAPPAPTVPAALRPFSFDLIDEDDPLDDTAPFALPFAAPQLAAEPAPMSSAAAGHWQEDAADSYDDDDDDDDEDDESGLEEAGYSSLLSMQKPFAPPAEPVRIEEPEPEMDEIEPVVVFPGQEVRRSAGLAVPTATATPAPFARPAEPGVPLAETGKPKGAAFAKREPQPASFAPPAGQEPQRFDAPAGGSPVAKPASSGDPAEAERALRAALANLQRISGAA